MPVSGSCFCAKHGEKSSAESDGRAARDRSADGRRPSAIRSRGVLRSGLRPTRPSYTRRRPQRSYGRHDRAAPRRERGAMAAAALQARGSEATRTAYVLPSGFVPVICHIRTGPISLCARRPRTRTTVSTAAGVHSDAETTLYLTQSPSRGCSICPPPASSSALLPSRSGFPTARPFVSRRPPVPNVLHRQDALIVRLTQCPVDLPAPRKRREDRCPVYFSSLAGDPSAIWLANSPGFWEGARGEERVSYAR